jgi:asparagine synthase (glutamine-hydrolysing)
VLGYLYFHNAPSAQALHHECISRIQNLYTSDCLRANKVIINFLTSKSTMAWGVEARVPFLDREFLNISMEKVPANYKLTGSGPKKFAMEKHVLRKAFDTPENPYLPEEVLWRQKEQFSDGVGYSWIDGLKDHAAGHVSDDVFAAREAVYKEDCPTTKEAYLYRQVFDKLFPEAACMESVVRWIPRRDWGCPEDPSGRAQASHAQAL